MPEEGNSKGQELQKLPPQELWHSLPQDARRLSVFLSPKITITSERPEMLEEFSFIRNEEGTVIGQHFDFSTAVNTLTQAGVLQQTTAVQDWIETVENYTYTRNLEGVSFEEQTPEERRYLLDRRLLSQYNANPREHTSAATEVRYRLTPEFKQFVGEHMGELERFSVTYDKWLEYYFENMIASGLVDTPTPLDPFTINPLDVEEPAHDFEQRYSSLDYDELDEEQLEIIQVAIYNKLGIHPQTMEQQKVREYTAQQSPQPRVPGDITISVYRTNEENIFLQELHFSDGKVYWRVGADQDI